MVLTHASYYAGASHLTSGKPVQDRAAALDIVYGEDAKATVMLLSDGHGSEQHFRSDIGAAFAIEAAAEALPYILEVLPGRMGEVPVSRGPAESSCMTEADRTAPDPSCESAMRMFFTRINILWARKVLDHWKQCPPPEGSSTLAGAARAYGCTLVGAVRTEDFWMAFQLGDGACVALRDDCTEDDPIPGDSRCRMSRTTSMCIHEARDFRYSYGRDIPPVLMLCSDGLADCYENHNELARRFLAQIAIDYASEGLKYVEDEIAEVLPEMSETITGDDMSLAFWIDTEAVAAMAGRLKELNETLQQQELAQAYVQLESYDKSIAEIEGRITSLSTSQPEEQEEMQRKLSVLSTLKRRQSELLEQIDSIKLNLCNRS